MKYYISKKVDCSYDTAVKKVTELLKDHGFGVLTQIDVKETLKKKIDIDFKRYIILGACNPHFAHKALLAEDKLGALLPCNVIVIEQKDGIEVCAINPKTMMSQMDNPKLEEIAEEVSKSFDHIFKQL
ncbi:MAG: DUF302 domain-containing protein [Bacteroidetes bacterium]|nr:DUF302 domain-containing protein [Bacteroidota bacterium]